MSEALVDIPGYRIIERLARGGMSTVYLAEQQSLKRVVAIKVMAPELCDDQVFGQRFEQEAQIASHLSHPNIVPIIDFGSIKNEEGNTSYYLVMAYVEGRDLKHCVHELTLISRLKIVEGIAHALTYLHEKGYVHRDIKPQNIIVQNHDKRAILTDFGIARAAREDKNLTSTGTTLGTPHYMSPEQALGKPVDKLSDIYSLGVVLFYVLAGKVPFDAESGVAVGLKHHTDPIPFLDPPFDCFQPIIDRSMAKSPRERYQSASEFADAISSISLANIEAIVQSVTGSNDTPTEVFSSTSSTPVVQVPTKKKKSALLPLVSMIAGIVVAGGATFYLLKEFKGGQESGPSSEEVHSADANLTAPQMENTQTIETVEAVNAEVEPVVENQAPVIEQSSTEGLEPQIAENTEAARGDVVENQQMGEPEAEVKYRVVDVQPAPLDEPEQNDLPEPIVENAPVVPEVVETADQLPEATATEVQPMISRGNLVCDLQLTKNSALGWEAAITVHNPQNFAMSTWSVDLPLPQGTLLDRAYNSRLQHTGVGVRLTPKASARIGAGQQIRLQISGKGTAPLDLPSPMFCEGG